MWERKSKAHYEPPPPPPKVDDLDADAVITPDVTEWAVEETPNPLERAASVDTYAPRPRRQKAP